MGPGYTWQGLYKVWPLEDFVGADLSITSPAMAHRMNTPHLVKVVEIPSRGIHFPLREDYEKINYTLQGLKETAERQRPVDPVAEPPPDVADAQEFQGAKASADRWVRLTPSVWARIHSTERREV